MTIMENRPHTQGGLTPAPPTLGFYNQSNATFNDTRLPHNHHAPRYQGGLNGRAVTADAAGGSPRLSEYQKKMNMRKEILKARKLKKKQLLAAASRNWGTHPNDFKLAAASSPYARPNVLSSPRTIYLYDKLDAFIKPEIDGTLKEGLLGTTVVIEDEHYGQYGEYGEGNGNDGTIHAIKKSKPSRGYGGQLYRGALVPPLSRWHPEKPDLLVGTHLNKNREERAQRLRNTKPKVPVGFGAKRGILKDPKMSPRQSQSFVYANLHIGGMAGTSKEMRTASEASQH